MGKITKEEAIECVRKLIEYIGDDPEREGLIETPERVIKSYGEIFRGYRQNPEDILQKRFTTHSEEMVVLSNIELYSTCEHHMLPFLGKCHIGYIPNKQVVGVSKLVRLMDVFARRLQIQEELTYQIADALNQKIGARGVAVLIEARHMCMTCRGVNQQQSTMSTTAMVGAFTTDENLKQEFLHRIEKD
ncbi:MAG: GTP cyclohydrolase I FolE [Proteobacteria bacterium]|nr:GTP cyclohydrolase I FolE [Pseudomonadota bacterium]